jgi:hypothetical protein
MIAATKRSGIPVVSGLVHVAGRTHPRDARIQASATRAAPSPRLPSEMPQGCLECPVSSYVATSASFR